MNMVLLPILPLGTLQVQPAMLELWYQNSSSVATWGLD
jgi:hypothetical protein